MSWSLLYAKIKERGSSPAHKTKNAQQIRAVMAFFGVTRMFKSMPRRFGT